MKNKLPRLALLIVLGYTAIVGLQAAGRFLRSGESPAAAQLASPPALPADQPTAGLPATPTAAPSPAPTAVAESKVKSPGDQLVAQAAAQLERHDTITARLRHQASVPGQSLLTGRGGYWQQGSADELRVRLELQIAGQEASLLQVSDNRFLWVERRLPVGRSVTRIKLWELRAESSLGNSPLGDIQPGNASWMTTPPELIAQSGGLPSLLYALQENFSFLPPQATRLVVRQEDGTESTSIPYYAVVGTWRKDKLAALTLANLAADDSGQSPEAIANSVPARLPQEVLIFFGQADLFPYRFEYRKLQTQVAAIKSGTAVPYELAKNPMLVFEFNEVQFDVPIAPGQFLYTPGDADWTDQTEVVLQRLRQRRDQLAGHPAPPTSHK